MIATGHDTAACKFRQLRQGYVASQKQVVRAHPEMELHLAMDNYAVHMTAEVKDCLSENPRLRAYYTPTSTTWLKRVERGSGIIERQALQRTDVPSVAELNERFRPFVTGWNDLCRLFV